MRECVLKVFFPFPCGCCVDGPVIEVVDIKKWLGSVQMDLGPLLLMLEIHFAGYKK